MPRNEPRPSSPETGMALVMPDDIRRDLLRAQGEQITTPQRLPSVRIMPAGAGMYEFEDTQETTREFEAVILNSHPRNILWDKPFSEAGAAGGEREGPACVSPDGLRGTPRTGFLHRQLGGVDPANGLERIDCSTCVYNRWGSKNLIDQRGGKGKACTNQKSIYLMTTGRQSPVEMVLPPTSLAAFDGYLTALTNQGILAMAVVTKFKQNRVERAGLRWSVIVLERARILSQEEFDSALRLRQQFASTIMPNVATVNAPEVSGEVVDEASGGADEVDMPSF